MSKLKDVRLSKNMTQKDLADAANVNVRVLQHYEQGSKLFDHARIDTILKICIALNCKIQDVLESEEYIALLEKYEK